MSDASYNRTSVLEQSQAFNPGHQLPGQRPFAVQSPLGAQKSVTSQSNHARIQQLDAGVLRTLGIQAKLAIGAPGDPYEQEADQVAAQVVEQLNAPQTPQPSVQRQGMEEAEPPVQAQPLAPTIQRQTMPAAEEKALMMKPPLQQPARGTSVAPDALAASIEAARGHGQPLNGDIRGPMEQAFDADFSNVRVHTDAQSDQLSRAIQARAFTTDQDVFFRQGDYQPGSKGGQELIAHELTHVVQQNGYRQRSQHSPRNSPPDIQTYKTSAGFDVLGNKVEFESSGFSGALAGGLDLVQDATGLEISSQDYTAQGTVTATGPKERVKEFEVGFLQTVYDSRRNFYYQPDPYNPGILEQVGTAILPEVFSSRLKRTDLCNPLPVRDGDAGFVPWYGAETVSAFDEADTSTKTANIYDKPGSFSDWTKTVDGTTQYLVKTDGQDVFRSWLSVQEKGTTGFFGMHRLGYIDWKVDYGTTVSVNKANPASSVVTPNPDSGGQILGTSEGFGARLPLMGDPVANDAAIWVESKW